MKANESYVFTSALSLIRTYRMVTPETVLFGYVKLLSMSERQLQLIITDYTSKNDLKAACDWFFDHNLSISAMAKYLPHFFHIGYRNEEIDKNIVLFQGNLEGKEIFGSSDILDFAAELSFIDVFKTFSKDAPEAEIEATVAHFKELAAKAKTEDTQSSKKKPSDTSKSGNTKSKAKSDSKDENKLSTGSTQNDSSSEENSFSVLAEKYGNLTTALLDVVKGQDSAVMKFIQGYNQGYILRESELESRKAPRSYFFFFGPPGVGKTLLAETAAEYLDLPYKAFSMSEYVHPDSVGTLAGTSSQYKNSKPGLLTSFVYEHPECVLVFDEIEKANPLVVKLFLQILGSGKLGDASMEVDVPFTKTTIIFTSNVGKDLYQDRSINLTNLPEKVIMDAIQNEKGVNDTPVLLPELCSRIASGNLIMFNHLSLRHLSKMAETQFETVTDRIRNDYGISINYSHYLPLLFLYHRGEAIDARIANSQSDKFIKNELFELIRNLPNTKSDTQISNINIDIDWNEIDPEIKSLFSNSEKSDVLIFVPNANKYVNEIISEKCNILITSDYSQATAHILNGAEAVFIDPLTGLKPSASKSLSVSDYDSDGVDLFRYVTEKEADLPVFIFETEPPFTDIDKKTFIIEGATDCVKCDIDDTSRFIRFIEETMDEIYMEKNSQTFCQRGFVIDFNTRQTIENQTADITFYDLKKRTAIDVDDMKDRLSGGERPNVKLSDVIGAENAKKELQYFIEYMKDTKQFLSTGGKPPQGILLYGPPGTGKTMLAKAMAGECDAAFFPSNATNFDSKWAGESEENIRKLFAKAKKVAPSIIFIDEIDAIGKQRTGDDTNRHTEKMLNALLTEMQGFSSNNPKKPVFVIAATNFGVRDESSGISSLDEALIRRFDNKIYIDLPVEDERIQFINMKLSKMKITSISDACVKNLAERTTGKSLSIIENVIELAVRNAGLERRKINDDDLLTALEDYNFGEKRDHSEEYYKNVAIHEVGHGIVAYLSGDKPSYVTIESRGKFGGYMQHANSENITDYSRNDLLSRIRCSLAGRAAEMVFATNPDDAINSGASSDLQNATDLAFEFIGRFGMDGDQLIVLTKDQILKSSLAGDYVARVNQLLNEQMQEAIKIIKANKKKVENIANNLAKEHRLTGAQFEKMMEEK